jgi:hypothetical protein
MINDDGYKTIVQLLLSKGYHPSKQPFIFFRSVSIEERIYEVEVDFLAGEYAGTSTSHRTQKVQDLRPRKARGCDLAVDLATETYLSGTLPGGGIDTVAIRVASIVPFLVMKAMALAGRLMAKDAWDIYYCVRYYPGGMDSLVNEFIPHLKNGLVREALDHLALKFASPDHIGPRQVADFDGISDPEERAFVQRDAFERINFLLVGLGRGTKD